MALAFRNVATHEMPAGPRCLSSSSGILLRPELLFALNLWLSVLVSSAYVMWLAGASVSAEYPSGGMDSS